MLLPVINIFAYFKFTGFGNPGTAGGAATQGTPIKFNPVTGTDSMAKNGLTQNINTRHQCITCMKEYENKSLEELRLEDLQAGRKGPTGWSWCYLFRFAHYGMSVSLSTLW
jgi:nuclear pore complex protein Nup98-Nup96